MATRNKVSSIQKIMIHSSRVGSQHIDKISLMRIPDTESSTLQADKCSNGAYNKIKKAVKSKPLTAKYRKLPNCGSCEDVNHSSANNGRDSDETEEQNTRTIIGDVPGHTPFHVKKKANKLSIVSKPHSVKSLTVVADSPNGDRKFKKDFTQEFSATDQNERVPSKTKNHNQKKKVESKKKTQGKELIINPSVQCKVDVQSLIGEKETKDNEIKPSSEETGNDKSTSNATVSRLRKSIRLALTPRKDYNFFLRKETTQNTNQNASVKVKMEIFNESQMREENSVPDFHLKNTGTCDKKCIVNDGECKEDKCRDPSTICSHERQKGTFENLKSMVVSKESNNNAGRRRKENIIKNERGSVSNGSNRISLLPAATVATRKSCLGVSREANEDREEAKYNDHTAICSYDLQKVKSEFIKTEVGTVKRERGKNSRCSTMPLTTIPSVRHSNLKYKNPSGDLRVIGMNDNVESNSMSKICTRRNVTCENRKSMVPSEANNSKAGNKAKENKIKDECGTFLRRSNRISLLPAVCYRERRLFRVLISTKMKQM